MHAGRIDGKGDEMGRKRHPAPILGRHQEEALHPISRLHYNELGRQGLFPPVPESLQGGGIKVEFLSAVQQAQRELKAVNLAEFATFVANQAAVFPESGDIYNADEGVRIFASAKSVDHRALNSPEDVADLREEREAQQQAAQQAERQQQDIENATAAAPALQAIAGGQQ